MEYSFHTHYNPISISIARRFVISLSETVVILPTLKLSFSLKLLYGAFGGAAAGFAGP